MGWFLALLFLPVQEQPFPLAPGHVWTYESGGRESLVLRASERLTLGRTEVVVLRSTGSDLLGLHALRFLTSDRDGLRLHSVGEAPPEPPQPLLQLPLKEGAGWSGSPKSAYPQYLVKAEGAARETVTVPAGTFEAWRVDYTMLVDVLCTHVFRAWFAPGTGFVQFELLRVREQGVQEKKFDPVLHRLVRFEKGVPVPRAEVALDAVQAGSARAWVVALSHGDPDRRDRAMKALLDLGWGTAPLLEKERARTDDAEVHGRIDDLFRRLPKLQAVVRARSTSMKVGEEPPVEFRLRNISPVPIRILPCLEASDVGWRQPSYAIEIVDENGASQRSGRPRCGLFGPYRSGDVWELPPGGEADPFRCSYHEQMEWRPKKAGRITIRLVCSLDEKLLQQAGPDLAELYRTVVLGRFESAPVTVDVLP